MSFSVTYVNDQFKFSLTGRDVFFNKHQVHFQIQKINTNLVYVGDELSNTTVNYTLCSSPTAASASLWIDAVKALIPASLSPIGTITIDSNEPLSVSASVTSAATLFTQDCFPDATTTYRSCVVQITANASGNTIAFEGSNDNTNWIGITGSVGGGSNSFVTSTTVTTGLLTVPLNVRYFRVRVSVYVGGTTSVVAVFSRDSMYTLQNLVTLSTGTSSVGTVGLNTGTNTIGYVTTNYQNVFATGSATIRHIVSAASTNAANIKAGTARIYGWSLSNTNAAFRYVKLHNVLGTPTAGVNVTMTIAIPPNGMAHHSQEGGIFFNTGLGITMVTGAADSDATAVGLNDIVGDLFYV
jgi:hypothetical protein